MVDYIGKHKIQLNYDKIKGHIINNSLNQRAERNRNKEENQRSSRTHKQHNTRKGPGMSQSEQRFPVLPEIQ